MLTATRFCVHCGTRFEEDATPQSCPKCDKSTGGGESHAGPGRANAKTSASTSGPAGYLRIGPALLPAWLVICVAIIVGAGGFGWNHLTHSISTAERKMISTTLPTVLPTALPTGLPTAATDLASPRPSTPVTTNPASPTPSATPTLSAIQAARPGECFDNTGTDSTPDLVAHACQIGTFQVVSVKHGTTDAVTCDDVPRDTLNFRYGKYDLVLCTTYLYDSGTAYSARAGSCVYGPNSRGSTWYQERCQTGNFTVVDRYPGTTDTGKCPQWPESDENLTLPVSGHPGLDALLCLSMNYPDAAGLATVRECLLLSRHASKATFARVTSCAAANVSVTGRTSAYDDPSFCGNDGATWWENHAFPKLAYTVCYRYL